ncbi:NAD-dependent epimerase/dehydratase family protein [Sphingomonas sp.]|uniref:NAD-dependent epimerase/dehydratase family protein n=1 Tax=Sphingomonas sp. TaxID=28214 RepID=UPI0035BBF0F9
MSRRALITGAGGFIGGRLAERLRADGWTVHALAREAGVAKLAPELVVHRYDGSTRSVAAAVAAADADVVFHLASLYLADHKADEVEPLVASNILLAAQIGEAVAGSRSPRLVNTGTAWQHYGGVPYRPVNLYAATKQAADDLLQFYADARGLSVITLKLFDTYGVGDTRRKLVQLLADAAVSGETLAMSPGEQTVDLTHVDDVVDAFAVAAERLMETPRPLCDTAFVSGERMTVRELAALAGTVLGRSVVTQFGGRPYRTREVMMPYLPADTERLPGWTRTRTLGATLPALAGGRAPASPG